MKQVEWWVRHRITYPVFRRMFRNTRIEEVADLRAVDSVLILRYDRFGDMIVTTSIVREMKRIHSGLTIGIAASKANAEVAKHIPGVDHVYVVKGGVMRVLRSVLHARSIGYDVVLNFIFNRTSTGGILANVMAPGALKVGQGDEKYGFYFNRLLRLSRTRRHMVNTLDDICHQTFGASWGSPDLRYGIRENPLSAGRVEGVAQSIGSRHGGYVVLNVTAGEARRNPTSDQLHGILFGILSRSNHPVVIVGTPQSRILQDRLAGDGGDRVHVYPPSGSAPFMDMVSLIKRATVLVSPDTSLVHVACAMGVPVCAMYASDDELAEWSPVGIPYQAVTGSPVGEVSSISVPTVLSAFERLLQTAS